MKRNGQKNNALKKNVFIVGSLFNLLLVVHMKRTLFCKEESDLIIFDGSKGLREIAKEKELYKYFGNVYFSETNKNILKNRFLSIISPDKAFCNLIGIKRFPVYTDIYFWNPEETLYYLVMGYGKRKLSYRLHLYSDALEGWFLRTPDEDMPNGYHMYGRYSNVIEKYLVKAYGFKQIKEYVFDYYMFAPEKSRIDHTHKVISIPQIDPQDKDFVDFLNKIFSFDSSYRIEQKYIFMDAASDRWGDQKVHDAVINSFVQAVGYENFIVKPHPRSNKEDYQTCNAQIESQVYPWDLYCLNHDISNKTLIIYDGISGFVSELLYGYMPRLISVRKCIGRIENGFTNDMYDYLCNLIVGKVSMLNSYDIESIINILED